MPADGSANLTPFKTGDERTREIAKMGGAAKKGTISFKSLFNKILDEEITIHKAGEQYKLTKKEAMVLKLASIAISDKTKDSDKIAAINKIIDRVEPQQKELGNALQVNINNNTNIAEQVNNPFLKLRDDVLVLFSKAELPCFFYTNKRYVCLEGGRGGAKSESVARFVVWFAGNAKNTKVLCGREVQSSIKESVKSLLDRIIADYGLADYFTSTDDYIYCKSTNTQIIFKGLKNSTSNNSDTLKSMDNVSLVWCEEAQTTSQQTIDKLDPTIRVEKVEMLDGTFRPSQIIFTYNRKLDSDPVHTYFVESEMEGVFHLKINYYQNPYLPEPLKIQAETMKAANYTKWLHIWFGEPQKYFEDSLWPGDLILKMRKGISFDRSNYSRVVVACDPAQTNKQHSNEYGIVVLGLTFDGEAHVIADLSGKHSPNSFATTAIKAYYDYQADAVVAEINAGGDFIKSTILSIDAKIIVKEVRADVDKHRRAAPVANLAQMGKVYHICGGHAKLESQMQRMTTRGFEGAPGESPDRLDAMVWGVYDLFNLTEMDSTELVFKKSNFIILKDGYSVEYEDNLYIGFEGNVFGALICDVVKTDLDGRLKFLVKDYEKGDKQNVTAYVEKLLQDRTIKQANIPDDVTGAPIINNLASRFVGVKPILSESYINKKLDERVIQIIPYVQAGQVCVIESLPVHAYNNERGDLFTKEITAYSAEHKADRPILSALANMIFLENDIQGV